MPDSLAPLDPAEPDLYWSGHSGWAILPGLVIGALSAGALMLGAPVVGAWFGVAEEWTAFVCFWVVLACGLIASLIWAYRAASFVYRLTPSFLHTDFGMLFLPVSRLPLSEITEVDCRAGVLSRFFGVGAVIVRSTSRPPIRLTGIFRPNRFAEAIRAASARARER